MLIAKELINKAIQHFPRWMNIRKRYFSSNGGLLLTSAAENIEDIQKEINIYIKEFFIDYYNDKCNDIVDFIYRINIGNYEFDKINILLLSDNGKIKYTITNDLKTFYENKNYAYFQDGFISIKEDMEYIQVIFKDKVIRYNTEKIHVWNVFDEFATLLNIKRYENETNAELYNRILVTSGYVINSSDNGIKNAIIAGLVNIVPELEYEDIILERPTAENLKKYYDEFNTILEHLTFINKDVLRAKKWDKDMWYHDFKKIDYIPNVWDIVLDYYKNGIGDNDDLKIELTDVSSNTNANVSFYEKDEVTISNYIQNENIPYSLNLQLQKYDDILNELTAEYKITASEVEQLNKEENDEIQFELYKSVSGKHDRSIDDLIVDHNNIFISKPSMLEEGKYYKVKFIPQDKYKSMDINKFLIEKKDGSIIDYKEYNNNSNFIKNGDILTNKKVKKYINKKSQLDSSDNLLDTSDGMINNNITYNSNIIINADNCGNELLKIKYSCNMTEILDSNITLNNFYYDSIQKCYKSDTVSDDKNIEINIKANKIRIDIEQGQCNIIAIIDNQIAYNGIPYFQNNKYYFETKEYETPKTIRILIIAVGTTSVIISDMLYSKYEIMYSLKNGELINEDNDIYFPNIYENELYINFKTYTQHPVLINYIFIGTPLDETDEYISNIIHAEDGDKLIIKSTCNVELYKSNNEFEECDKTNSNIIYINNYNTDDIYIASSNDAYIILNTSEYKEINNIEINAGTYEVIGSNENLKHIIYLKLGESINKITIDGTYNELCDIISLTNILNDKIINYNPYSSTEGEIYIDYDKVYINKLTKNFILKRNNLETSFDITYNDFTKYVNKISVIKILNIPQNIQSAFITILNSKENIIIDNVCDVIFNRIYFYPKSAKEYVAINQCNTFLEHKENIEIINTFNNGYNANNLMIYTVEPIQNTFTVLFDNNTNTSIGKSNLYIDFNIDYLENDTFNYTKRTISKNILLQNTVKLDKTYIADNKEIIELSQYVIDDSNPDYDVIYDIDINNEEYRKAEYINIYSNNKFNKLRYSNIVSIEYIGPTIINIDDNTIMNSFDDSKYDLIKDKGIIIWNDKEILKSYDKIYIIYTIKKPIGLKFNLNLLYKKIDYNINAYNKTYYFELHNINDSYKLNLINPNTNNDEINNNIKKYYNKDTVVYIECSNPLYSSSIESEHILFNKHEENLKLSIRNGWYYFNEKEYFLYANNSFKQINNNNYIENNQIEKIDNKLIFHKKSYNYINNSKMTIGSFGEIYNIDNFNKLDKFKGCSLLNSISACENYNKWNTFGMNLSLNTNGLNGLGIYFEPYNYEYKDISYAFINIDDFISDVSYISFYKSNDLKVYIGISYLYGFELNSEYINNIIEITDTYENLSYYKLIRNKSNKYYLVVKGTGVIDDIIISDTGFNYNYHNKNINILNYNINEEVKEPHTHRLFIENNKGYISNNTEINSEKYIINSSNIDWNITMIKKYSNKSDFVSNFILDNVSIDNISDKDCIIKTTSSYGNITSLPIYLENYKTVNKIIYKINSMNSKETKDISCKIYQSKNYNNKYINSVLEYSYTNSINYTKKIVGPYFKLSIDIPPEKIINSIEIYIEYKSNNANYPLLKEYSNGTFVSKVLDTYNSNNYKIKEIGIDNYEGIYELYIRGSKESAKNNIWTEWKRIYIENNVVTNDIEFEDYRFFQFKVILLSKDSKIKISYIDLEVK